jgi:Domain of unknown function (DUF1905)/Bacteriocin-protection, YdeI or OmpD-Associated
MIQFKTTILRFQEQGEKTGWTYITIPSRLAQQLKPGTKKSFRVKGKLDNYAINGIALLPMGGGDFIMALNAAIRKNIGKRRGDTIHLQLEADNKSLQVSTEFMECLSDEPTALEHFNAIPKSHQMYFSKWIETAKTEPTKTKRIAMALSALSKKMGFSEMIREYKKLKDDLRGV